MQRDNVAVNLFWHLFSFKNEENACNKPVLKHKMLLQSKCK